MNWGALMHIGILLYLLVIFIWVQHTMGRLTWLLGEYRKLNDRMDDVYDLINQLGCVDSESEFLVERDSGMVVKPVRGPLDPEEGS